MAVILSISKYYLFMFRVYASPTNAYIIMHMLVLSCLHSKLLQSPSCLKNNTGNFVFYHRLRLRVLVSGALAACENVTQNVIKKVSQRRYPKKLSFNYFFNVPFWKVVFSWYIVMVCFTQNLCISTKSLTPSGSH